MGQKAADFLGSEQTQNALAKGQSAYESGRGGGVGRAPTPPADMGFLGAPAPPQYVDPYTFHGLSPEEYRVGGRGYGVG